MKKIQDKSLTKSCPDEIYLNRYVLHQSSTEERHKIENHLAKCSSCRKEVIFLTQTQSEIQDDEAWGKLPSQLYKKAQTLVKEMLSPRRSSLDICLQFVHNQWEIIKHTGTFIPQPAFAVRGDQLKTSISTLAKEFDGYKVEVDAKGNKEATVDLRIKVKISEKGILASKVRFTLKDEKKQRIIAELTRDGTVLFEGLPLGEYSIFIEEAKRLIANIYLDLIM